MFGAMKISPPKYRELPVDLLEQHVDHAVRGFGNCPQDMALVDSVEACGILYPLLVHPHPDHADSFQILDGHRRHLVLRKLKIKEVLCGVYRPLSGKEYEILRFTLHETYSPWTKAETKASFKRLQHLEK